ncbi:50S ribosomal protein L24 [Candidatus Pacearchaeota archaeon]|nr:50S ribosomal protein L24 [Candidatus Pacearchaeota archaeon]|tara:strand:- start:10687 stop:11175 length:489 start_codon:yes stop_codon:yes gene_type:complete
MKSKYSTSWKASKQPRKQRKYKANAPLHTRHKFLNANLSKTLRKKYGKRALPLRKGDEVLVMRGSFKKKKAKIVSVDLRRTRVTLENIQRTKKDGTKVSVPFSPSSLQIQTLTEEDRKRFKNLAHRSESSSKSESRLKQTEAPSKTPPTKTADLPDNKKEKK